MNEGVAQCSSSLEDRGNIGRRTYWESKMAVLSFKKTQIIVADKAMRIRIIRRQVHVVQYD